ncbi:MAG: hypothetical protein F6K21_03345 [Symploca sp. SIO2D2]|nr:hypothetical protein [Symploca sp. SIO2D2]
MSKKKSILVATIGTRDLAFQVSSQEWLNLGNDRAPDGDSISEQALVQMELGLDRSDFRLLSEYLLENWETYQHKLQPIILGQLLQDESKNIKQIYLVATDQLETPKTSKFRGKDTLHSAEIIKKWIKSRYQVSTEVILQGSEGGNPADFEEMFRWWKQTWRDITTNWDEKTLVLLSVKGGVGAFSEAARVTALSRFGENTLFYDFIPDDERNRKGEASNYTIPLKGTNYLWDRKQQEGLALLKRYDYEAVGRTLQSYWRTSDTSSANGQLILRVKSLIEAATKWNTGNFLEFAKDLGESATTRQRQWWWTGYEAAYLGQIRFKQGNTVEAMFHSFRAVEGLMSEWALHTFPQDTIRRDRLDDMAKTQVPLVKRSIANHPGLRTYLNEFQGNSEIPLYSQTLDNLVQQAKPNYRDCVDILQFWNVAKIWRNQLFHRLLGLQKEEVFRAWGTSNYTTREWESRVLGCLNFLSGKEFSSLSEASLMSQVHRELEEAIASYQP